MTAEQWTPESLAAVLTGREYPFHISKQEAEQAKAAGLVVVYGASDDLMEFEGAIYDELGAWDGTTAYLTSAGLLGKNECDNDECPYFKQAKKQAKKSAQVIKALWCKEGEYSWTFKTEIPHSTFEVVEDGEPYCRGIVFRLEDVQPKEKSK